MPKPYAERPLVFHPVKGHRLGTHEETDPEYHRLLSPWLVNPWTGETRRKIDVRVDPRMQGWGGLVGASLPPEPLTTLAEVRTAKQQLEGDILALIQQFEKRTGVGVRTLSTRTLDLTALEDARQRTTTQGVHLTLEPL